jgi:alpha-L-rhamnosidase
MVKINKITFTNKFSFGAVIVLLLVNSLLGAALTSCQPHTQRAGASNEKGKIQPDPALSISNAQTNLPIILGTDGFKNSPPIWAHNNTPSHPEIALFRHTFTSDSPIESAELHVFADTRYEVWFDGVWIGRGPARFSKTLHEYDYYELGAIREGEHLIAVLVQWAPNNRRSESVSPMLKAHLQGITNGGFQTFAETGSHWKTMIPEAWRQDSVPVHSWGLIGPTELLDLRSLDQSWNQPGYQDSQWGSAVEKSPLDEEVQVHYQPRSIAMLADVPTSATISDVGSLSPLFTMGELLHPVSDPFALKLIASKPTTLTVETLFESQSDHGTFKLDGCVLTSESAGEDRPDVYQASMGILPGSHTLLFENIPPQGMTFNVSTQDITYSNLPFEQGVHAGRRLLLAEPVSDSGQVKTSSTPDGVNLEFLNPPAYAVLDLGRTVHGRLSAQVSGPSGSIIDIGWDERLSTDYQRPLPFPGSLHPEWNQVDSWILDGSTREISTIDARAGRYILIAAWGDDPIHIDKIRVHEERYPVTQSGEFNSSNPLLDRIWQLGTDTAQVNMTDAYADPWRERGQWWGDAYVVDHVNRVAFGDTELLKRGILFMSNSMDIDPSPGMAPNNNRLHMLDYTMLWVHSLHEYIGQTQDNDVLESTYPKLLQFMEHLESYENPGTGLLDLPQKNWGETAYIDTFGYHNRYGQSTALNSIYYGTLNKASKLAGLVGDAANSSAWQNKAQAIKDAINSQLYLPSEHRYVTNLYESIPYKPTPYAQAWPLAYGIVPPDEVEYVVDALLEPLSSDPSNPNVNIYGMFWVLKALGKAGYIPEALDIIELYYGHLLDSGATTLWEHFNSNLHHNASLSHGWGGAPTWFLTTYILGAKRAGPNTWTLKPALTGVDYASGSLPLRDGTLHIEWERETCQEAHITINAEDNSSGEVLIPFLGPYMIITLDGQTIWEDETGITDIVVPSPNGVIITVNGGSHTINIHTDC